MHKLKWLGLFTLLLVLGACSETNGEQTEFVETGFAFTIDPQSGSVTLSTSGGGVSTLARRELVPGEDLALVDNTVSFLPGNILSINASFNNISETLAFSGLSFVGRGDNYLSSAEPIVSDADLGGDGVLAPGETTSQLSFRVTHKGEAFTYFVAISADVEAFDPDKNEAPVVAINSPEEGLALSSNVTVTGTAADDAEVTALSYSLNGGADVDISSSLSAEDFSFVIAFGDLAVGENTVSVTAEDAAGLTGSDSVSFNVIEEEVPTGSIVLTVRDASSNEVIPGVSVELDPNDFEGEVLEEPAGTYTLNDLPADTELTLDLSAPGYIPLSLENVSVPEGETAILEALLTSESSRLGNVSGTVSDAQTGDGVANATINLREGGGVTSGPIVQSTTTSANGDYVFNNLAAGNYTAEATSPGYITNYFPVIVVGGTTTSDQNVTISRELESGELRVVLTWSETPRDLDSHMTGPTEVGNRFHVYYVVRSYGDSATDVDLDVDDVTSFGPETVTIREQTSGTYRYSVHDFTNRGSSRSSRMAASGAKVQVFQGNSLLREFSVPNEAGTLWTVFELDGSTIVPINELSYQRNSSAVQ